MVTLRPNPPPVSPALARVIQDLAQAQGIQIPDPIPLASPSTPTSATARSYASATAAAEAASEWNSLLIQARAERGPQWDVLGQRYLVDVSSDLYFDPAALNPPPPEDLPDDALTREGTERPMVNGILHEGVASAASASPHLGTIGIGPGGGGTFSPSVDGREGSRFETPRRSLRSSGPNGA
ncbi:hypothetical protein DACRYDRAFT_14104 [Dacryopinax primogenitus]|uniref:Uncharacterized protein n=1 Tax=Dacryopinax primogenitus (strain DJM 731) TaxID=1858805 RepID=M5GG76_DACPD|nr:uncharacterized protein DACRYDRAFT_14104 [Dacryopinax primogenitus]EJU05003.1 hypothetical protein DACRYDRAFT_14104 [Dacryopinax primogenitus]